jgi:hypothetical protein
MVRPSNCPIDKALCTHSRIDRPVHTVVFSIAIAGFLLLSTSRAWPGLFRSPQRGAGYVEIPLNDIGDTSSNREIPPDRGAPIVGPGPRVSRLLLVASVCALTLRIELFRQIYKATECTVRSVEVINAFAYNQRVQPSNSLTPDHCAPCYLNLRRTTLPGASTNRK